MRRWVCTLQVGALLSMLVCGVASAATVFSPTPANLGASLFAKCFGESTDRVASFSAVTGDSIAESPLRELALRFDPHAPALKGVQTVRLPFLTASVFSKPSFEAPVVNLSDAAYRPHLPNERFGASAAIVRAPVVSYYQSAAPLPTDAPLSHRFDLSSWQVTNVQPSFNLTSGDVGADVAGRAASVNAPVNFGRVHFSPHAEADFSQNAPSSSLSDRSLTAGTTFDVRAGRRDLGVDVSSGLEHVTLAQPQYSSNAAPNVGLTGEALPVFVPAYADVSARSISAGVTVPVTRSLSAGVQYDTQHLLGAYGVTPGLNNLDANNTMVGAQVTFKLPKSSSAISLSARQFHYQDNLVPSAAVTQTNANLNYTVKF